ncbi:MAG: hypothetical protein sL5_04110 [Candidatus Mesenet longicola]|uniref:Uncharacterized protein n=1 Tax=Candidatus Mesenet longicola TaxID=1892558 RepID=A0A8J3MNX7_9RICK|nr:MAG: hypothetical protein sGL2_04220 [Candidatus Mesenet longicola]GHM59418.1 MAG: hypothetical protein sL5_04110 [Candidatus Mesenet longicola]
MLSTDNKELQFKLKILQGIKAWIKRPKESLKLIEMKSEQNDELKDIKTVARASRPNVKQVLNQHLQDRTLQPLEKFKNSVNKEVGVTEGYQAEYQYDNQQTAAFMIKSFFNKTLSNEERKSRLNKFKDSFYRASERNMKLFPQSFLLKFDAIRRQTINMAWLNVEQNICYDDLNIADFIREYFAGDLYRLLLQDRAPLIELVTNQTLPAKRFVEEESGDKYKFKDHYIELFRQEKNQPKLFLRSKFLHNFTTLTDLKANGKKYKDAEGFEKILAAQMLLGEADIIQAENFGLIEKGGEKAFAKIDHGRSFYYSFNDSNEYLMVWLSLCLTSFDTYGLKIDFGRLCNEVNRAVEFLNANKESIELLMEGKAQNLNHILNSNMEFTLRYIHTIDNDPRSCMKTEDFSYSKQSGQFISNRDHSLNDYFKERLNTQIEIANKAASELEVITKISKMSFMRLIWMQFYIQSGETDILTWAINHNKKIDGKNPLAWAIENNKQIEGGDAVKWAKDHDMTIDGRDPETFAHIIRDKNLSKYLKAGAQLKKTAVALFIGVLAELATVITIYCKGIEIGMTAQQQSLYLKIAIVTTVVTAIVLLGIAASVAGIKHHLDHSKNHTIENPKIDCVYAKNCKSVQSITTR